MARIGSILTVGDFPEDAEEQERASLGKFAELYDKYMVETSGRRADKFVTTWALTLNSPTLAYEMLTLSNYISHDMPWAQQMRTRILVIQTINKHLKCEYSYRS